VQTAAVTLGKYEEWIAKARSAMPFVGAGLLALGVVVLLVGLFRRAMRVMPVGALATLAGALVLVVGLMATKENTGPASGINDEFARVSSLDVNGASKTWDDKADN
jgi:hypothetical protein